MKVVWLAHYSVHLEVRLVKAPYRGINKLPAEPVVMIYTMIYLMPYIFGKNDSLQKALFDNIIDVETNWCF